MHNWLQCKIHSMNRRARTETPVHVIKLQQHNDADSSTKLYRKLHFFVVNKYMANCPQIIISFCCLTRKPASSQTWKCKWIAFGLRTVTKLVAELAVRASARQELQVRPTLFQIRFKNLFINFTSLLCSYNQGSFHHTQSQHSHPPTSKVKNAWYYTSTPPYAYSLLLIDYCRLLIKLQLNTLMQ